jgi:hypothetical protein
LYLQGQCSPDNITVGGRSLGKAPQLEGGMETGGDQPDTIDTSQTSLQGYRSLDMSGIGNAPAVAGGDPSFAESSGTVRSRSRCLKASR